MSDCTFIIFGASGDLAKRKLFPAVYQLFVKQRIEKFIIVGASNDDTNSQMLWEHAQEYIPQCDEQKINYLIERTYFHKLNFLKEDDFAALNTYISSLEKKHRLPGNRIFYLAAASQFYCTITQYLAQSGLASRKTKQDKIWHRIVYEKPFGHDLDSAHEINTCIKEHFDETQIYRVDHYLTKELVDNIALIRFTNLVFEPLWNSRYIDNVQIILSEKVSIENRGAYYDAYGALSDVVQNHMLELVALIGMESPSMLTGDYIRQERAKVLEKVEIVDAILGQYEGYKQEKQVKPNSTTETFALVHLKIKNPRWNGVPFYLKTGKCLDKKETVIHIKFKQVDCLLAKNCPSESNYLTIQVFPEAIFSLGLNIKKPGLGNDVTPIKMEFCHSCIFGTATPQAHEVIFEEIMRGEQSISVRFDEIESAWKAIDTIKEQHLPVYPYKKGSTGPVQAEQF